MLRQFIYQLRLTWRLLRDSRVPLWVKSILIVPVVYTLSPLDLIPDVILVLGQIDDAGVIYAALRLFEMLSPGYVVEEHRRNLNALERGETPGKVVDAPKYTIRPADEERAHGDEI